MQDDQNKNPKEMEDNEQLMGDMQNSNNDDDEVEYLHNPSGDKPTDASENASEVINSLDKANNVDNSRENEQPPGNPTDDDEDIKNSPTIAEIEAANNQKAAVEPIDNNVSEHSQTLPETNNAADYTNPLASTMMSGNMQTVPEKSSIDTNDDQENNEFANMGNFSEPAQSPDNQEEDEDILPPQVKAKKSFMPVLLIFAGFLLFIALIYSWNLNQRLKEYQNQYALIQEQLAESKDETLAINNKNEQLLEDLAVAKDYIDNKKHCDVCPSSMPSSVIPIAETDDLADAKIATTNKKKSKTIKKNKNVKTNNSSTKTKKMVKSKSNYRITTSSNTSSVLNQFNLVGVTPGQAWVRKGNKYFAVRRGDKIAGLGTIISIDANNYKITTSSGVLQIK